jgi:hypothetical protein
VKEFAAVVRWCERTDSLERLSEMHPVGFERRVQTTWSGNWYTHRRKLAKEMGYLNLLSYGITNIVEKHFGSIPERVIYEGAVLKPSELPTDCTELAKTVLAAEPGLNEVFSAEDISRRIESIVIDIVREGTYQKSDLVEVLCTRLDKKNEAKLVLIPLQGIKLVEPVTQIGPFRLRLMDDEAIAHALALWNAAIDRTANTPEEKSAFKDSHAKEFDSDLQGTVCLEVRLVADIKRAETVAVHQAMALIDLLRYGSSGLHHKSMNLAIGFKGDGMPGIYRRYILPVGESDAIIPSFRTGPFGALVLDANSLQVMGDLGVQKLAGVLERRTSQFETAVALAVHWFAESRMQTRPEYEIVTLAIALEAALSIQGQQNHGRNILSEAVAVLLSDDPTERTKLFDLTRVALWNRGDVLHHGANVLEWDELKTFRNVVRAFIAKAIHSTERFQTTAELLSWVASKNSGLVKLRAHGIRNARR